MPNRPQTADVRAALTRDENPDLSAVEGSDKTPPSSPRPPNDNRFGSGTSLGTGSRLLLVAGSLLLLAGFGVSAWLSPDPRGYGTHQQFGLPPCSLLLLTGKRCPSCGGTTAFAHFVRGQWPSAVRANAAAFVLALACAVLIPWCWASAAGRRLIGIANVERTLLVFVIAMSVLFALQWAVNLLTDR